MKSVVDLTSENEQKLNRFKALCVLNGIDASNKEKAIAKAIEILDSVIIAADEDTFTALTGLKKTF